MAFEKNFGFLKFFWGSLIPKKSSGIQKPCKYVSSISALPKTMPKLPFRYIVSLLNYYLLQAFTIHTKYNMIYKSFHYIGKYCIYHQLLVYLGRLQNRSPWSGSCCCFQGSLHNQTFCKFYDLGQSKILERVLNRVLYLAYCCNPHKF